MFATNEKEYVLLNVNSAAFLKEAVGKIEKGEALKICKFEYVWIVPSPTFCCAYSPAKAPTPEEDATITSEHKWHMYNKGNHYECVEYKQQTISTNI